MLRLPLLCRYRPPRLASMILELTTPEGLEEEMVISFEYRYRTWAVPKYRNLAPVWAYSQAFRAVVIVTFEAAKRFKKRAS